MLAIPKRHTEATTSRPLLLHGIGRQTKHPRALRNRHYPELGRPNIACKHRKPGAGHPTLTVSPTGPKKTF